MILKELLPKLFLSTSNNFKDEKITSIFHSNSVQLKNSSLILINLLKKNSVEVSLNYNIIDIDSEVQHLIRNENTLEIIKRDNIDKDKICRIKFQSLNITMPENITLISKSNINISQFINLLTNFFDENNDQEIIEIDAFEFTIDS
ncbi:MAG: hypothetical protein ACMXYB_00500 [Candidatus Woesearchaeota archaeon]